MSATTPSVTLSPAEGVADGAELTVSVSGFGADEKVFVTQGAQPGDVSVFNLAEVAEIRTDADGAGSTSVAVRRQFTGLTIEGGEWGPVDADTVSGGMFIGASTESGVSTKAPITFA